MDKDGRIKELEGKVVAACLAGGHNRRCPHAKQAGLRFECTVKRSHCHSVRVRRWLAEIEKLEEGA